MQKLIQIEINFEIRIVIQLSSKSSLEVVKLLEWLDASDSQFSLLLLSILAEHRIEDFLDFRIGKLGFQVPLTVECRRLDEAFWLVVFNFEEYTVSWHLHVIVNLYDISNFQILQLHLGWTNALI